MLTLGSLTRKIYNWYTDVRDKIYTRTWTRNMMRGRTHTSQSRPNELRAELCCLCRSSISSKRKRLHGTSCTKAKANCAQLIAVVFNVQSSQPSVTLDVVAPSVSAIVALVIRAYKTVLNGIKG